MKQKGKISKIPSNEPVKYYVTEEATLRCAFGSETVKLKTPGRKTARINDKLQANIMDFKPMMNIPSFGLCRCRKNPAVAAATAANHGRLTPVPCVPNTTIPWINGKDDVIMDRAPALLNTSTNMCLWGGKLGFVQFEHDNSGQRIEQGITSMLNGAMMIFIGMASIEASLAAMLICPLPSVVLGASGIIGAGATTTAMGMSDVAEGEQEVWYGATGSTRESVNPVLKHAFKGNRGAYNSAEIIATLVASCGLIAIQPYAKSLGMKKAAQGATSPKPKPVNTSALRLQGEKVNAVEETKLAGNAKSKVNPKIRLPRTQGRWEGKPGNGKWYSTKSKVLKVTKGEPIEFQDNRPNFKPWSEGSLKFKKGELDGTKSDYNKVYKYMKDNYGFKSNNEAKNWLRENGLTPHHLSDTEIQLVPTDLNNGIPHIGSASDMRGGFR
jgi:hypothetical protein